jgi:hypothetical protein
MSSGGLARRWDRFWFAGSSAIDLAAARIAVAGHALWLLSCRDLAGISAVPGAFWSGAKGTARYAIVPGHPGLETVLQCAAGACLAAALLGIVARPACLLASLLLYHLAPLETIIWTASPYARGFTISVLSLFVLGLGPCDQALALAARGRPAGEAWEYAWPLRAIQVFLCQIYFFAFLSKVYVDGLEWPLAENMRHYLLVFNQDGQVAVFSRVGLFLAEHSWLCLGLGAVTFALEAGFPLVLVSRRARSILVPTAALFHVGVLVSMNIFFFNAPQLLVFVDWGGVARRLGWRDAGPRLM